MSSSSTHSPPKSCHTLLACCLRGTSVALATSPPCASPCLCAWRRGATHEPHSPGLVPALVLVLVVLEKKTHEL